MAKYKAGNVYNYNPSNETMNSPLVKIAHPHHNMDINHKTKNLGKRFLMKKPTTIPAQ